MSGTNIRPGSEDRGEHVAARVLRERVEAQREQEAAKPCATCGCPEADHSGFLAIGPCDEYRTPSDAKAELQSRDYGQDAMTAAHVCHPEQTDERTATCPVCHAVYTLDEEATADERSYADGR